MVVFQNNNDAATSCWKEKEGQVVNHADRSGFIYLLAIQETWDWFDLVSANPAAIEQQAEMKDQRLQVPMSSSTKEEIVTTEIVETYFLAIQIVSCDLMQTSRANTMEKAKCW